jgi:hypothetical protein
MGYAMGWLAVAAALAGATQTRPAGPEIRYQIKLVEVRGLDWRRAPGCCLKPATHKGVVTVWTAPEDLLSSLPEGTVEQVVAAPRVIAGTMSPAHVSTRKNQSFVTQVAWKGQGKGPRGKTESVREGMAATIAGRSIDQGVLVQLVIEDTEIHSVHTINVNPPAAARHSSAQAEGEGCSNQTVAHVTKSCESACAASATKVAHSGAGCDSACPAAGHSRSIDAEARKASMKPEAAVNCCADDADNAGECHGAKAAEQATCGTEKPCPTATRTAQIQIPEVGHAEASGEWLIPRDEVLVVGFGPHTVADKDGKAVVRERLALISAEEVEDPSETRTATVAPPAVPPSPAATPAPAAVPPPPRAALAAPLAIPALPSRSTPQGVHADGTPAELPPLPEDEKVDEPSSGSSQPMPSPQTKKPKPAAETSPTSSPAPSPSTKPGTTGDAKTSKASFKPGNPWLRAAGLLPVPRAASRAGGLSSLPLPLPIPNLQFMVPLKPFSLKLPLNQKLELELVGRVVPDFDVDSANDESE